MKNVVIYSHSSLIGGAERSMLDLANILASSGFSVHIIIPSHGEIEKELLKRSIPYLIINFCWWINVRKTETEHFAQSFNNTISALPKIAQLNPCCIITNTSVIPWGAITAKLLNVPHIWNIREFVEKDSSFIPEIAYPELARLIYSLSDRIWLVSSPVKKQLEKYIPSDKSSVIHSQIVIPKDLSEKKISLPYKYKDSFKLIIAGSIDPNKGQDQAIKATKMLINNQYNVELLIIGHKNDLFPKYHDNLFQLVGKKYRDRIHFGGFVHNPYPYIKGADVLLSCSKSEGLSRSLLEAGLLRKTFVSSDTDVNKVNGNHGGLYYRYGDFQDLARKIEYLVTHPERGRKLAIANQKYSQARFARKAIFKKELPRQILKINRDANYTDTFNLIRRILEINNPEPNKFVKYPEVELNIIKSSKAYKIWQKYYQIRDGIKSLLRINNA